MMEESGRISRVQKESPSLMPPIHLDAWFQPYKDSVYSVEVIYLSFLNLPPQERNKEENVAVVGIIPGPQEPSRNVN